MRFHKILALLVGASSASAMSPAGFDTPEDAVRGLEAAYVRKDLDAAVKAKDFVEEARLMLEKLRPKLASDAQILKQTAEVLELSFRKEIHDEGFPDFGELKCSFTAKNAVSATLVKLTEECTFPDGGKSRQELFATKGDEGWRVVTVPTDS